MYITDNLTEFIDYFSYCFHKPQEAPEYLVFSDGEVKPPKVESQIAGKRPSEKPRPCWV